MCQREALDALVCLCADVHVVHDNMLDAVVLAWIALACVVKSRTATTNR